ncbi:uncharacterized protein LOC122501901 isoform X3 [Leptopilina heterotoma]|uniref:uncharacterized protein LOC122501901 isoform X3 n=1 Tax=Leptopilina heterotoma TaxID=63436 RepID=UPI001CA95CD7|nr:uncharacterized protein LOC122501901 isoform X3 [Leptopilina heterotoma]
MKITFYSIWLFMCFTHLFLYDYAQGGFFTKLNPLNLIKHKNKEDVEDVTKKTYDDGQYRWKPDKIYDDGQYRWKSNETTGSWGSNNKSNGKSWNTSSGLNDTWNSNQDLYGSLWNNSSGLNGPWRSGLQFNGPSWNNSLRVGLPWGSNQASNQTSWNNSLELGLPWGSNQESNRTSWNNSLGLSLPWGSSQESNGSSWNNSLNLGLPWGSNQESNRSSWSNLLGVNLPWGSNQESNRTSWNNSLKLGLPWGSNQESNGSSWSNPLRVNLPLGSNQESNRTSWNNSLKLGLPWGSNQESNRTSWNNSLKLGLPWGSNQESNGSSWSNPLRVNLPWGSNLTSWNNSLRFVQPWDSSRMYNVTSRNSLEGLSVPRHSNQQSNVTPSDTSLRFGLDEKNNLGAGNGSNEWNSWNSNPSSNGISNNVTYLHRVPSGRSRYLRGRNTTSWITESLPLPSESKMKSEITWINRTHQKPLDLPKVEEISIYRPPRPRIVLPFDSDNSNQSWGSGVYWRKDLPWGLKQQSLITLLSNANSIPEMMNILQTYAKKDNIRIGEPNNENCTRICVSNPRVRRLVIETNQKIFKGFKKSKNLRGILISYFNDTHNINNSSYSLNNHLMEKIYTVYPNLSINQKLYLQRNIQRLLLEYNFDFGNKNYEILQLQIVTFIQRYFENNIFDDNKESLSGAGEINYSLFESKSIEMLRRIIDSQGRILMNEDELKSYVRMVLFKSGMKWPKYINQNYLLESVYNIIITHKGENIVNLYELQGQIINFVSRLNEEKEISLQVKQPQIEVRLPGIETTKSDFSDDGQNYTPRTWSTVSSSSEPDITSEEGGQTSPSPGASITQPSVTPELTSPEIVSSEATTPEEVHSSTIWQMSSSSSVPSSESSITPKLTSPKVVSSEPTTPEEVRRTTTREMSSSSSAPSAEPSVTEKLTSPEVITSEPTTPEEFRSSTFEQRSSTSVSSNTEPLITPELTSPEIVTSEATTLEEFRSSTIGRTSSTSVSSNTEPLITPELTSPEIVTSEATTPEEFRSSTFEQRSSTSVSSNTEPLITPELTSPEIVTSEATTPEEFRSSTIGRTSSTSVSSNTEPLITPELTSPEIVTSEATTPEEFRSSTIGQTSSTSVSSNTEPLITPEFTSPEIVTSEATTPEEFRSSTIGQTSSSPGAPDITSEEGGQTSPSPSASNIQPLVTPELTSPEIVSSEATTPEEVHSSTIWQMSSPSSVPSSESSITSELTSPKVVSSEPTTPEEDRSSTFGQTSSSSAALNTEPSVTQKSTSPEIVTFEATTTEKVHSSIIRQTSSSPGVRSTAPIREWTGHRKLTTASPLTSSVSSLSQHDYEQIIGNDTKINERLTDLEEKPQSIYTETKLQGNEKENLISHDEISLKTESPIMATPVSTILLSPNVSIQSVSVEKNGIELPWENLTINLERILQSQQITKQNYLSKITIITKTITNLFPSLKILFPASEFELIIKDNIGMSISEGYSTDIKKLLNFIIMDIKNKYKLQSTVQLDGKIVSNKYTEPVIEISWTEVQKNLNKTFATLHQFSQVDETKLSQNLVNIMFEFAPTIDSHVSYSSFQNKILFYLSELKKQGYTDFTDQNVQQKIVGYMQGLIKLYAESMKYLVVFNITQFENIDDIATIEKQISKEVISLIFDIGPENIRENSDLLKEDIIGILDNYEIQCVIEVYDSSVKTYSDLICRAESRNSVIIPYVPPPWDIILSFRCSDSCNSASTQKDAALLQSKIYDLVSHFLAYNDIKSNFESLKAEILKLTANSGYDFNVIVRSKLDGKRKVILPFPRAVRTAAKYYRLNREIRTNAVASYAFNTTITNILDNKLFNMGQIKTGIKAILEEHITNEKVDIEAIKKDISGAISTATADMEVNVTIKMKGKLYPFTIKHRGSDLNKRRTK